MNSVLRIILAFTFAALWLPLAEAISAPDYDFFWSKMTAIFTVSLTLLVAVPGYFIFRKQMTFWLCALGGTGAGVIGALLYLLLTNWGAFMNAWPAMVVIGLITGIGFWVVGFLGAPKPNNSLKADGADAPPP